MTPSTSGAAGHSSTSGSWPGPCGSTAWASAVGYAGPLLAGADTSRVDGGARAVRGAGEGVARTQAPGSHPAGVAAARRGRGELEPRSARSPPAHRDLPGLRAAGADVPAGAVPRRPEHGQELTSPSSLLPVRRPVGAGEGRADVTAGPRRRCGGW